MERIEKSVGDCSIHRGGWGRGQTVIAAVVLEGSGFTCEVRKRSQLSWSSNWMWMVGEKEIKCQWQGTVWW